MITVAETAGFCFGVNRAVKFLEETDNPTATLGPIIHNTSVVDDLNKKGVTVINEISELPENTVLAIRTHGVGKQVYEKIEALGYEYVDLTCPFVKKIHRIVADNYAKGYKIVIIGDKNHPEVMGINGWCENKAIVALDISDLSGKIEGYEKVCVVSQTTMDRKTFEKIKKFLKNHCQTIQIFDTICSATNERQIEAQELAKSNDVMVVIGGFHSSNSKKLAQVCKKYCEDTYQIECFEDFPQDIDISAKNVGITAGASTPSCIIKEVSFKMEEMNKAMGESFAEQFEEYEKSLITLHTGDRVTGTVIGVSDAGVSVNLGYKSDGFIPASEVTDEPNADIKSMLKAGDEIEVFVVRVNDVEGEVTLSKKKIDAIKSEDLLVAAAESKEILTGKVVQVVNKGIIVSYKGARVFVPASQASDRYLSDLSVMVGEEVSFRIIDMKKERGRNKIVGSVKDVLKEQKAVLSEKFWSEVEVGKTYTGTVKSLTKFGAFVDIGGVDGLIHISELSWTKIKHPSEVVSVGDVVETYVLEADKEKGKVSLGYKKTEDNPWNKIGTDITEGSVIDCKIVRIVPFGAFAEILPGIDGLIHISQVANKRIGRVEEELTIGQHVQAKVVEIDMENKKIGLSIRALMEETAPVEEEVVAEETAPVEEEVVAEETAPAEEVAEQATDAE